MMLFCISMGVVVHGFAQNRFGIVGNVNNPSKRVFATTTKYLQDSTVLTNMNAASGSSHTQSFKRMSPSSSLWDGNAGHSGDSSNGDSDFDSDFDSDSNSAVEAGADGSSQSSGTVLVEDSTEEGALQYTENGGEVSYLMDDNMQEAVERIQEEVVSLIEENIGEDDMEQVLAAGVVATLGTGNLVSENVYLDDETGEVYELSPNADDDDDNDDDEDDDDTDDEDDSPPETDHGGVVSGLFGNLRIPASLLAGASLGQAFALPFADADGLILGMVKRVYVLCMLGSFSSMLLTVLVSTTVMTDITLSNPRLAKSPGDYINRYYALEYMLTKLNFFLGSGSFAIGSMLRGWIFLNLALVGRGVLGIMGSFTLMSASIVLEYSRRQTGKSWVGQLKDTLQLMQNKTKKNRLFGVGAIIWASTVIYLFANIPQVADYLIVTAGHEPVWRKLATVSGGFLKQTMSLD
ncbi:MAG: hypothetical protein SGBAC_010644 [Bacillariaceae sp.]